MSADDKGFRLLGLSGSIRQSSTNTIILRTIAERLDGGVSLTVLPLDDVPLYNSDLEGERLPDAVRALKTAIAQIRTFPVDILMSPHSHAKHVV